MKDLQNDGWSPGFCRKLAKSDPAAWNILMKEMLPGIEHYLAKTITDAELLADAVFQMMCRLWSRLQKWDPDGSLSLKSLCYRIANDLATEHMRQQDRERVHRALSLDQLSESPNFDVESGEECLLDTAQRSDRSSAIRDALLELTPQEQDVLHMMTEPGFTQATAVTTAGYALSENPENLIKRLRRKLRSVMMRHPYFQKYPEDLVRLGVIDQGEVKSGYE